MPRARRLFVNLAKKPSTALSQEADVGVKWTLLKFDPHNGTLYVFRGRRRDLIKILRWDGQRFCLFCKRLERGKFLWPQAKDGSVSLTGAQLSMLLEGIDWRAPVRTWAPETAC